MQLRSFRIVYVMMRVCGGLALVPSSGQVFSLFVIVWRMCGNVYIFWSMFNCWTVSV